MGMIGSKDRNRKSLPPLPPLSHCLLSSTSCSSTLKLFNCGASSLSSFFQIFSDLSSLYSNEKVGNQFSVKECLKLPDLSPNFGHFHHFSSSKDGLLDENEGHGLLTVSRALGTSIKPLLAFYCAVQYRGSEISPPQVMSSFISSSRRFHQKF